MVTAIEWDISGTYLESCNCDTVCPCVFLSARLHSYWCLDSFGNYRSDIRTPRSNGLPPFDRHSGDQRECTYFLRRTTPRALVEYL